MSEDSSPLRSLFDAQQDLITNGQEFVEQSMRVPLEVNTAVRESLAQQQKFQRESIELTHDALDGVFDTVEPSTGDTESVRAAVDDGFEALLAGHERAFDTVDESYAEAIEDLEAAIEELTEQVEALVELSERIEDETVEAVGGVADPDIGEFLERQFGTLDADLPSGDDSERGAIERQRESIDTVRERIERLQTELEDTVDQAESDDTESGAGESDDTESRTDEDDDTESGAGTE